MGLENCSCGMGRKRYWLWQDTNAELHASAFPPSQGVVRVVVAATSRDALLSATVGNHPKHDVSDPNDLRVLAAGRCASADTATQAAS